MMRTLLSILLLGSVALAIYPTPLNAQTLLRGTVREVHSDRVRVSMDDQLLPAIGDSAAVGQRIPGLGRVPSAGAWHVQSLEGEDVWLQPGPGAVQAVPGGWAEIHSWGPSWAPSSGFGKGGSSMEPTLIMDLDFSDPSIQPSSSSVCQASVTGGRLLFRNQGETGRSCRYVFVEEGGLEGEVEVSARFQAIQLPERETLGLLFGFQANDSGTGQVAFNALLIGLTGSYKVTRLARGQWTDLKGWTDTDALRRGPGAENELAVKIQAGVITAFANGQFLGEVTSPVAGGGGVGVYLNETGSEIAVDDMRVVQLGVEARDPASSETVLSSLDFDHVPDGPHAEDGACRTRYQGGALLVANITPASSVCRWMFDSSVARVDGPSRLSVTTKLLAGPVSEPMGIIFGRSERASPQHFVFEVDGSGRYKVAQMTGTEWVSLMPWTRRGEISVGVGAENRLSLELDGTEARLFVNGAFLRSVALPASSAGHLGLYVDEPGAEVLFDDIKLERIRPTPSLTAPQPGLAGTSPYR